MDLDQGSFYSWEAGKKQFENINKVETWLAVFQDTSVAKRKVYHCGLLTFLPATVSAQKSLLLV